MNFWRLQCFVALAEAKHFGRAAERLFISQPALSMQIRQLEESLGVALVVRHPAVALTESGERLYPEALKILELVNDTALLVAGQQSLTVGRLRLHYTRSLSAEHTFDLMQAFREHAPGVEIDAQTMWTAESVERIRAGLADAAFVRLPLDEQGSLDVVTLGADEQVVVLRRDHPLAERAGLSAEELSDYPLIRWPRHDAPGNHDALLEAFSRGIDLRMDAPLPNHDRLAAVARSDGYALIHLSQRKSLPESLVTLPVLPEAPRSEWGLVWDGAAMHEGARIARALADFLRRHRGGSCAPDAEARGV